MRRQALEREPHKLAPHDHAFWSGSGDADLYELAGTALAAGAGRYEKLLFVSADPDPSRLQPVGDVELLLARGQLELHSVDSIYGDSGTFSHTRQLEIFEGVLGEALADGYTGIRVVADNTPLVFDAAEADYLSWLRWEQLTDSFQAVSQVTGICYFDSNAVTDERLADLAALHPVRVQDGVQPPFSFFTDADSVFVTGNLDLWSSERFTRVLAATPGDGPLVVDLSRADFVDHRALLALNDAASAQRPVQIRGASRLIRELPSLFDLETPHLHFEPDRD
jgi:DcmR-like sensory protein